MINFGGRFVAQGLVQPPVIVYLEVTAERVMGFNETLVIMQINFLVFDRPPQPFREDVVKASAPPVHTDLNAWIFPQLADILKTGELAALVGVVNLRSGNLARLIQGRNAEVGGQGSGQLPRQDVSGIPVENSHQIEPDAFTSDKGDIRAPDMVGMKGFLSLEQIGEDWMIWARFTGVSLGKQALQAHFPH